MFKRWFMVKGSALKYLKCPICDGDFLESGNSVLCKKGHCYDISKRGYINFSQNRKEKVYGKNLFKNRSDVFEMGVFEPVIRKINQIIECFHIPEGTVLVDAGCGEGFYTRNVRFDGCALSIGFDLSKDAIQYASKKDENAFYMVADLANIPLKDDIAGVILDVFTPANYKEFKRILKTDGILVKVVPKEKYLIELRQLAAPYLINKSYDSGEVKDYTEKNVNISVKERISYKMEITPEEAIKIAQMTPMFNNIDIEKIDFSNTRYITIDEEIIVGSII